MMKILEEDEDSDWKAHSAMSHFEDKSKKTIKKKINYKNNKNFTFKVCWLC